MRERMAVLFTNEAFYAAFAAHDTEAMGEVWAREAHVTCIHPGWAPLIGREAVMQSWSAILSSPSVPRIACFDAEAWLVGGIAYIVCFERVNGGWLAATNLFVREAGAWKMVHHQAAPCPAPKRSSDPPAPSLQ